MECNRSTCGSCRHRWSWVGWKTGVGKTPAQLEQMRLEGKTCPRCGAAATVDLDHQSPGAQTLDGVLGALFQPPATPADEVKRVKPDEVGVAHCLDGHSGPGWYYWYVELPEEGSVGPFGSRELALQNAEAQTE